MASIWREPGKLIWRAKFKRANGKYTNRSTKETNKKKAQAIADFWEKEANKISKGLTTPKRILKAVADMAAEIGMEKISIFSIRETFQQFIDAKKSGKRADSTIIKYESVFKSLFTYLGEQKSGQPIQTLSEQTLLKWRDATIKSGIGATTADQYIEITKLALKFAVKKGWVSDSVADGIEPIGEGAEQRERFTDQEVTDLYDAANDEWKGMILLGLWYGMRINDASNLKWGNVHITEDISHDCTITYTPLKTGRKNKKPVALGMPTSVKDYLKGIWKKEYTDDQYIFPSLGGKKTGSGGGLSNAFTRLMNQAKISVPTGAKKTGLGRTFNKKGFHSLRHTMVSRMAEAGIPVELGMAISVHANRDIHQRYVHFTREVQRAVFTRLNDFLGKPIQDIEYYI